MNDDEGDDWFAPPPSTATWHDGVLHVAGEIDAYSCHILRDAIIAHVGAGALELTIDLTDCTFCNAACVAELLAPVVHRVVVTLRHPKPAVLKVLRALEVDELVTIES